MTQKVKKFRSEKHLKFIRSLPCIRCCSGQSQAAHIRMFTDGGTSLKPSDNYTVPLCHKCHQEQHQIGELAFLGSEEKIRALIKFTNALVGCGASGKYGHFLCKSVPYYLISYLLVLLSFGWTESIG